MNVEEFLLIIYIIGVIFMGGIWVNDIYCKYKRYEPITLGYVCAVICVSFISWFSLLVPIALALRENFTVILLMKEKTKKQIK